MDAENLLPLVERGVVRAARLADLVKVLDDDVVQDGVVVAQIDEEQPCREQLLAVMVGNRNAVILNRRVLHRLHAHPMSQSSCKTAV